MVTITFETNNSHLYIQPKTQETLLCIICVSHQAGQQLASRLSAACHLVTHSFANLFLAGLWLCQPSWKIRLWAEITKASSLTLIHSYLLILSCYSSFLCQSGMDGWMNGSATSFLFIRAGYQGIQNGMDFAIINSSLLLHLSPSPNIYKYVAL